MILRRRGRDDMRPIPEHPYRDAAIVYLVMAVALVVVATLTGGSAAKAVVAAAIFFVLATGWSWWHFRARIRAREAALAALVAGEVPRRPAQSGDVNGHGRESTG